MSVRSYVLIEAEVGTAKSVSDAIRQIKPSEADVLTVDTVTGPYDIIAQLEAGDLNKMGSCIADSIQSVLGVKRTTTCLTVLLS